VKVLKVLLNPAMIFLYVSLVLGSLFFLSVEKENDSLGIVVKAGARHLDDKLFGIELVNATTESGLEFDHHQTGMMLTAINEVIGSGSCTADYDGDGYLDIYAVNGSGFARFYGKRWFWSEPPKNALYRNLGNGQFKEVASSVGVDDTGFGMGCTFADYDNDGHADLYVTNYGKNILYHNNGDGTFKDVTDQANVGNKKWGTSSAWADYDRDGDLDLYVVNYIVFDKRMRPGEPNSAFKAVKPLMMNSGLFDGERNVLYRNNGNGTFTDVTDAAGVANSPGKGMGVVFFDYDNDQDSDIYITNDKSRNILYRNNGDGTFTDVGGHLGVDSPSSGMGVTVGDYDNDGDMDIFSTYPQSETNILYKNDFKSPPLPKGDLGGFKDVSVDAGLGEEVGVGYFGWATEFVDMNNDGYLDLFVANGHGMMDFDNPQVTIGQRNQIFKNNQDGSFSDVSEQVGQGLSALRSSRGASIGDFDNDGDLDIFIVNNNGQAEFLKTLNKTDNHWVNIKLNGTKSNRDAVGARVKLITEDSTQIREVRSGSGYLSQMDTRLHFGLAESSKVDTLEIIWPSGEVQQFKDLKSDCFMVITEGSAAIEVREFILPKDIQKEVNDLPAKIKNLELTLAAIDALGDIPGKEPLDYLMKLVKYSNGEIVKTALQALGRRGESEIVEPLINALKKDDETVKRSAAFALSAIFEREDIIFRSTMLKKREAVTALIQALAEKDTLVRQYSVKALGFSESYRTIISIIELFKDENEGVRFEAVRAAGFLRDKRAIKELLIILNNQEESADVRAEAVLALKRLESEITMEPLIKDFNSVEEKRRLNAGTVLLKLLNHKESVLINKNPQIQEIARKLPDKGIHQNPTQVTQETSLKPLGARSLVLFKILNDKNDPRRKEVMLQLGQVNEQKVVPLLMKIFQDKAENMEIRKASLAVLTRLAPEKVFLLIKEMEFMVEIGQFH